MKKNRFFLIFLTLISYCGAVIVFIILFIPILLVVAILPPQKRLSSKLLFSLLDGLYRGILYSTFLPIIIKGREIPKTPTIFVANHQSFLDTPLMGMLMNRHPHTWYILEKYANIPLFRFFTKRMLASINQNDPVQAARGLLQGIKRVEGKNCHLIIFPEGGRYTHQTVNEFFKGFVVLARKLQRAVVPVYIVNNKKILPPGNWVVQRFPFYVIIGPSYWYQSDDTDETFVQRVKTWFEEQEITVQ